MLTDAAAADAREADASKRLSVGLMGIRENALLPVEQLPMSASNAEVARLRALRSEPVVLRLRHIGKSYPIAGSDDRVVALKDITLAELGDPSDAQTVVVNAVSDEDNLPPPFGPVRRGEFVMIRGPSGGGKTTLLNIIGTIDACTEGSIELNDRRIDKDTNENVLADIRLKSLGFVFQTFNLIATMTAAENVELPMTLLGKLSNKEIRLRARQLLTLVGLRNRINHLPSELSGGEQQRVTIARSLANSPALLLLDEPTGDLDTSNTIEIMDLLIRINRRTKTTCIMVTHNPDIECYADRILYVNDGRFGKEVYNAIPTCLNLDKYTKYLAEKERQITGLRSINENASSDAEDDEAAASVGGSVVRLRRNSRVNSSSFESSHGSDVHSLRHTRQTSNVLSENASEQLYLSREPTGFSSKPAAVTPLGTGTRPAWRRERSPLPSAAAAHFEETALSRVAQREEKEANEGM